MGAEGNYCVVTRQARDKLDIKAALPSLEAGKDALRSRGRSEHSHGVPGSIFPKCTPCETLYVQSPTVVVGTYSFHNFNSRATLETGFIYF